MTVWRLNHLSAKPAPRWYRASTWPAASLAVTHAVKRLVQLRRRTYTPAERWLARFRGEA